MEIATVQEMHRLIVFIYIRRYFGSSSGLFTAGCQPFLFCSGSSMPYIATRSRAKSAPLASRSGMSAGNGVANPRAAGSDGNEKNEGGRDELTDRTLVTVKKKQSRHARSRSSADMAMREEEERHAANSGAEDDDLSES